ncbi:hypothetical protein B0H19DRAFT_1100221 [Mycena capillaripes]|nr:hypothetical protein B0H19DRAFT_1144812 [Mycena capillaripes]KAJ6588596.1 hypothetical protein B0H19DRAFT_1100221 [Mycena capillaripes]
MSAASSTLLDTYTEERLRVIAQILELTTDLYNKTFNDNRVGGKANEDGWMRGSDLSSWVSTTAAARSCWKTMRWRAPTRTQAAGGRVTMRLTRRVSFARDWKIRRRVCSPFLARWLAPYCFSEVTRTGKLV